MTSPRAVIFDLDDTLAESFKRPSDEMLGKLRSLLERVPVAIMTGAGMRRMESQFLPAIAEFPRVDRFFLFPNSSAQCYVYENAAWKQLYNFALTEDERLKIKAAIEDTMQTHPLLRDIPHYGQCMFDREAQVAYTPVGIDATLEYKKTWDPEGEKRTALFETLTQALPEFEVLLGGTTTIDVTRKGINKSYGVRWLAEHLRMETSDMLYVGDAFHEGGNDAVVIATGINTHPVTGPTETTRLMDELIANA